MSAFEYLLILAAVILGLAVTDLAVSLKRLMSAHRRVRWDFLPLLAGLLAFVRVVAQWWSWRYAETLAKGLTFGMFVVVLFSATLLFLTAASALPDEPVQETLDLRAYWTEHYRRFWLLFAAQWATWAVASAWAQIAIGGARFNWISPVYLVLPAALLLALLPNRLVQFVGLCGFLFLYAWTLGPQTLGH